MQRFTLKPNYAPDERSRVERLRLLCEQSPLGLAAHLLAATLIVLLLQPTPHARYSLVWAAYMGGTALIALLLAAHFYREPPAPGRVARWELMIAAITGGLGLGWGALALALMQSPLAQSSLLLFTIGLIAVGGAILLQASRLALAAYALPAFGMLALAVATSGARPVHIGIVSALLLLFAIIYARAGRILRESVCGQLQNEAMLEEVAASELSLKVSLDEHRLMFDAAPVGIAVIRESSIVRCNRRLEEIFAYRRGGLTGASTKVLFQDEGAWIEATVRIDATLRAAGAYEEESVLYRRDGQPIWCRRRGHAIDQHDLGRGALWVFEDLSEKKAASERLAQVVHEVDAASARLHDAIESVPDAFALFDAQDRLLLCNRVFAQTFAPERDAAKLRGLSAEELVRFSVENGERIPEEFNDDAQAWIAERVRRHRNPEPEGFVFQLADGRWMQAKERRTSEGGIVGVHADITALKAVEEQVRHLANHDPLTGLPNRRLLHDRMTQAFNQARRSGQHVAVMVMDLDEFKAINDSYGHKVGDRVLQVVSGRLRTTVRQADTVSRLGGDEFVVVLPELHQADAAARVAEKILFAIARPIKVDGQSFNASASIGLSMFPADGEDVETLLKCADVAMYRAKEEGHNLYGFYSPQGRTAAA